MVPEAVESELRTLVNKSVWLLRLMKSTPQSDDAYKGFLRRFREIVSEAGHKMDVVRLFVTEDEYTALLSRLDCTWDDKRRKLRLPDVDAGTA